jgi:hypothetical protein
MECFNLPFPSVVAFAEKEKALDPINITLLKTIRVMLESEHIPNLIKPYLGLF